MSPAPELQRRADRQRRRQPPSGLDGDDRLVGGGGADCLNGGTGTDTANYSDSAGGVTVSLVTGQGFGGTAEGDTLTSIENLTGSAHDDFLIGNDGDNVLTGLRGRRHPQGRRRRRLPCTATAATTRSRAAAVPIR